jgi:hypothetical protein
VTTKRWLGNAAATVDLWTVSLSGTVTSQTYSMTINGKSVTYLATGSDTLSSILLALQNAWNNTTTLPLPPPEFQELTAAALPSGGPYSSMSLTQDVAGRPTTISVSTSGAATFSIANTTAATGPSFFDNPQNWSGGVAPANGDTLVFDVGSVPCAYNINTSLTGVTVNVNEGYTGAIGLPLVNGTSQNIYVEYRTQYLTLAGGTVLVNSSGITRCKLAFGSNTASVRVLNNAQRPDKNVPVVLMTGGNSTSTFTAGKGDIGIAFYANETAQLSSISTAYISNPKADVKLVCGLGSTVGFLTQNGGTVTLRNGATTANLDVAGGLLNVTDAAAITTLNAYAGTVNLQSIGTIGTLNLYGQAIVDCSGDARAKTVTTFNVNDSRASVKDPSKTINSGVLTLVTAGLQAVNVNHGGNSQIVFT